MAGYFGTPTQQALQARAEASAAFIDATAGACQAGRTMGCDDPERLGWERVLEFLNRDRVCGFRLIPAEEADRLQSRLEEHGFRFDRWDVFLADRETAFAASEAILSLGLPDGFRELEQPKEPKGRDTVEIQTLMNAAGVVPFSGSMLTGRVGPASTVSVGDKDGAIVAAAHGYMPHNSSSPYHQYAWGGLVAVDEAQRGHGLGRYVNALMVVSVFRDLNASHLYELVAPTNLPSRRMVESCGLRHEPALVCGVATPHQSNRFTR